MTRDKIRHEIGDIIGMRYKVSGFIKQLPMPSATRVKVLRAIQDIRMDFYVYKDKLATEVWQSFIAKVANKFENICLESGINKERVRLLLDRLKQLRS